MSLAYNALVRARISDSKWKPSIYVDIVPPKSITDLHDALPISCRALIIYIYPYG